jgi:hypothetical protein
MPLNPLRWRTGHKLALVASALAGQAVGFWFGMHAGGATFKQARPISGCLSCMRIELPDDWQAVIAWAAVGTIAGGAVFYVIRLIRFHREGS